MKRKPKKTASRKAAKAKPKPKPKRGRRLGAFQVVGIDGLAVATVVYSDGTAVPEGGEPYRVSAQRLAVYKALAKTRR